MTPWHYRWLCQLSYINLPAACIGKTLLETARYLADADRTASLPCGRLSDADREALSVVADTPSLASLTLADFINRNSGTGLVACLLRSPDGALHMIFRGSESRGCGVPTGVDWLDNFLAPFHGSIQYPEIADVARRFPDSPVTFSGHSKGAHNALYALASRADPSAQAVVFNGQGFSPRQFSRAQRARLASQAVHYVVRGDVVGSLLFHPERRVFVRRTDGAHPHSLAAFTFGPDGQPVPALRPLWSLAVELSTRLYLRSFPAPSPAK